MPLPPSRRDTIGPPPRDVSDLAALVRHHGSALRQVEPGLLGGRFATPRPVPHGGSQLVGGDGGGEAADNDILFSNTDTVTAGAGDVAMNLTYLPEDGSEHVFWHPKGKGGIPLLTTSWSRVNQALTIPAFVGQSVGDVYTCRYAYYQDEADPPTPSVVGYTGPGVWDATAKTLTYALPTGTAAGDLLALTVRGNVAPGGGELILGLSCADPRMTLAFTAVTTHGGALVVEQVWTGIATSSTAPIVVNVTQNPSYNAAGEGVLAAITGANGWGSVSPTESGAATPTVAGIAAVAATWIRATSFGSVDATPPSGYTDISSTGLNYSSTDLSFWFDPDAAASPTGTFTGEGACVIAII